MPSITITSKWSIYPAILVSLLLLTFCSDTTPIKIGYVAGLTGRHSELGIGVRNGVTLAVDAINSTGGINGRKVEVVVRDDKSDPAQGTKVIKELLQMQVPVIIGPLLSKMASATLAAIDGQNVLVISPTISTDTVIDKDDNFLRVIAESSFQGESICL